MVSQVNQCLSDSSIPFGADRYLLAGLYGCEWVEAIKKAATIALKRARGRIALHNIWYRKMGSIVRGCRHRTVAKNEITQKRSNILQNRTWEQCITQAINAAYCRLCSRVKQADPWTRKFNSTTRNWRRKVVAKGIGGNVSYR